MSAGFCQMLVVKKTRQNRVFRKLTKLAIMAILTAEALLREMIHCQIVTPCGNSTQAASDSKFNTIGFRHLLDMCCLGDL